MRWFIYIFTLLILSACAPMPYQSALQADRGFLDEETTPGVYAIEVKQPYSWWKFKSREQHIEELKAHWQQRAEELCQHGYQGEPEIIIPNEARIEAFQCGIDQCSQQPMASGLAWCHKRYRL